MRPCPAESITVTQSQSKRHKSHDGFIKEGGLITESQ